MRPFCDPSDHSFSRPYHPHSHPSVSAHSDAGEVHGRHCQWNGVPEYQEIHTPGPGRQELHVSDKFAGGASFPSPRMNEGLEPVKVGAPDRCGSQLFVSVTKTKQTTKRKRKGGFKLRLFEIPGHSQPG